MLNFAAILALFCAAILFFKNDPSDRAGWAGFVGFWILFGIAFAIIGGIFALISIIA